MAVHLFQRTKFNDGQGLDFNDLNGLQQNMRALMTDGILGARQRTNYQPVGLDDSVLAVEPGSGFAYYVSALKVSNGAGLIGQLVGTIDGLDWKFLPYVLDADELQTTLAAADPSNPRIDLIEVKLAEVDDASVNRDFKDNTTGVITSQTMPVASRVKISIQVKQGTPAGTPAKPSVDVGWVPWCWVTVRAAQTTLDPRRDIEDAGLPFGFRQVIVPGIESVIITSADWAASTPWELASVNSSPSTVYLFPRVGDLFGSRLVGVRLVGLMQSDTTIRLVRMDQSRGAYVLLDDLTSSFSALVGTRASALYQRDLNSEKAIYASGYNIGAGLPEPTGGSGLYVPSLGLAISKGASAPAVSISAAHFMFAGQ